MALIESVISMACAMAPTGGTNACSQAVKATSMQAGWYQEDNKYEGMANNYAVVKARDLVGDKGIIAGGVAFVGYQLASKQPISFDAPSPIICDAVSGGINPSNSQYTLTIKWYFK